MMDEVGEHAAVVVEDDRALGNRHHQIVGRRAVLILSLAVLAVARAAMGMITKREERRDVVIGDEPDIATLRAVATVGAAARHMRFTAKRDGARATVTTAHIYSTLVNETRHRPQATGETSGQRGGVRICMARIDVTGRS